MKMKFLLLLLSSAFIFSSCSRTIYKVEKSPGSTGSTGNTKVRTSTKRSSSSGTVSSKAKVFIKPVAVDRNDFVKYAKSLLGTPYQWGSSVPAKGLDCSGFVYNVFQRFNVSCPRTTVDYTYEGREISLRQAKPGDLILFTGSDNSSGIVGHMGIITRNDDKLMFIHSASGKKVGVIINEFKGYYETHFVKIISVLQ